MVDALKEADLSRNTSGTGRVMVGAEQLGSLFSGGASAITGDPTQAVIGIAGAVAPTVADTLIQSRAFKKWAMDVSSGELTGATPAAQARALAGVLIASGMRQEDADEVTRQFVERSELENGAMLEGNEAAGTPKSLNEALHSVLPEEMANEIIQSDALQYWRDDSQQGKQTDLKSSLRDLEKRLVQEGLSPPRAREVVGQMGLQQFKGSQRTQGQGLEGVDPVESQQIQQSMGMPGAGMPGMGRLSVEGNIPPPPPMMPMSPEAISMANINSSQQVNEQLLQAKLNKQLDDIERNRAAQQQAQVMKMIQSLT
jgi:hypothetical protein